MERRGKYCFSNQSLGYESVLGAKIKNKENREFYNRCIEKLTKKESKISWEDLRNLIDEGNEKLELIEECYKDSRDYSEFFKLLKEKIKNSEELCLTLKPWIEDFMRIVIFDNNTNLRLLEGEWIVDMEEVPAVEFKEQWLITKESIGNNEFKGILEKIRNQKGGSNRGYKIL